MATSVQPFVMLEPDISSIEEKLRSIVNLIREWYGDGSQVAIRADEVCCALQRLKWELERQQLAAAV